MEPKIKKSSALKIKKSLIAHVAPIYKRNWFVKFFKFIRIYPRKCKASGVNIKTNRIHVFVIEPMKWNTVDFQTVNKFNRFRIVDLLFFNLYYDRTKDGRVFE